MCFCCKVWLIILKRKSVLESLYLCVQIQPVYKQAIMKSIRNRKRMRAKSILNLQSQLVAHRHQSASYWTKTWGLGEGNMLSITQNNICLPARALRTTNKIRQRTKATVPLLPPHVSFSFSSLCSLPFCFSSFAGTVQTFSGLSSPPLLRELAHKPSSCTHGNTHACQGPNTHGHVN